MLLKFKNFTRESVRPFLALVLTLATVFATAIYAIQTIRVFDGTDTYVISTVTASPERAIKKLSLRTDYEIKNISKGLYSTDITISYLFPLHVTIGDKTETYSVSSGILGELLENLGVEVNEYSVVSPSLDTEITEEAYVDIVNVEYRTETVVETLSYASDISYSSKYSTSYNKVVTQGQNGEKNVTYSVKYVNGVAVEKTVLSEEVTKTAVNEKKVVGTSEPVSATGKTISKLTPEGLELDANGIPVNYSSVKTLHATAYTHTGRTCSTGVWPTPGYVAVDPKEIPYGTKMYIVSADGKYVYGYAIAADTGGFIHGTRTDMDLFFDTKSECINFGRRNITVYFLD